MARCLHDISVICDSEDDPLYFIQIGGTDNQYWFHSLLWFAEVNVEPSFTIQLPLVQGMIMFFWKEISLGGGGFWTSQFLHAWEHFGFLSKLKPFRSVTNFKPSAKLFFLFYKLKNIFYVIWSWRGTNQLRIWALMWLVGSTIVLWQPLIWGWMSVCTVSSSMWRSIATPWQPDLSLYWLVQPLCTLIKTRKRSACTVQVNEFGWFSSLPLSVI